MPLVVDFHGAGSNMTQQDIYSGFDPVADKQGFVVVSPNAADQAVRQWRFLGDDDVAFSSALVQELVTHACVDRGRVYATGISSGAAMSTSLACRASDVYHAFGLVAAEFYSTPLCGNAKVRPIVLFHGNADPIVPYDGGAINAPGASNGFQAPGAELAIAGWAKHNGCKGSPIETHPSTHVIKHSWKGCKQPVVLYEIDGGGHTWPGAAIDVTRLGNTTHEISATNTMLKVFQAAP
jgi:polyhydroxybutyrate depolymerase